MGAAQAKSRDQTLAGDATPKKEGRMHQFEHCRRPGFNYCEAERNARSQKTDAVEKHAASKLR
jgi:hypothetical protein